jgi:hypothetical protein
VCGGEAHVNTGNAAETPRSSTHNKPFTSS